jgi:uncharacterized membrane protein
MSNFGLYALCALFVVAGAMHFVKPGYYRPLMPPYIPFHEFLIFSTGMLEILLGLALLWNFTRGFSAWAIIIFLLAVLPVHFYMLQERNSKFAGYGLWFLLPRIPAQFLLMWWAFHYT